MKRIMAMYTSMSQSQQRIANVILEDPDSVAFYHVAQLAKASNVSDSTVTRFATFLGYTGYPALSQVLQAMVKMRLTTRERFERSKLSPHDDPESVYYNSMIDDIENIKLMVEGVDAVALQRAVELIENSDKVGIICSRSAVSLGLFFDFYLNILHKQSFVFTGDPRTIDRLTHLTPTDIVVSIGFSRYSRFAVNSLMYCKRASIPSIAVTDYPSSPLALLADVTLFCPTGIASHMDSLVAPLALIQAILRGMSSKQSTTMLENLKNLEGIWDDFGVYMSSDD